MASSGLRPSDVELGSVSSSPSSRHNRKRSRGANTRRSSAGSNGVQPVESRGFQRRQDVEWNWKEKAKLIWRTTFAYADRISDFLVAGVYFSNPDPYYGVRDGVLVLVVSILPSIVMMMLDLFADKNHTFKTRLCHAAMTIFQVRLAVECYRSFQNKGTSIKHSLLVLIKAIFESFPQSLVQLYLLWRGLATGTLVFPDTSRISQLGIKTLFDDRGSLLSCLSVSCSVLSVSMTLASGAEDGLFDAGVAKEQFVRLVMGRRFCAWLTVTLGFLVDVGTRMLSFSLSIAWFADTANGGHWWLSFICLVVMLGIRIVLYYIFDNPPRDWRASVLFFGPTTIFIDAPLLQRRSFLFLMLAFSMGEQALFYSLPLWIVPLQACPVGPSTGGCEFDKTRAIGSVRSAVSNNSSDVLLCNTTYSRHVRVSSCKDELYTLCADRFGDAWKCPVRIVKWDNLLFGLRWTGGILLVLKLILFVGTWIGWIQLGSEKAAKRRGGVAPGHILGKSLSMEWMTRSFLDLRKEESNESEAKQGPAETEDGASWEEETSSFAKKSARARGSLGFSDVKPTAISDAVASIVNTSVRTESNDSKVDPCELEGAEAVHAAQHGEGGSEGARRTSMYG